MDLTPVYQQALDTTAKIVAGVAPDQLDESTPCDKFDVRALLNHAIGGNYMFATLATGEKIDFSQPTPDLIGDDAAAAYDQSAKAAFAAFQTPGVFEQTFAFPFGDLPGTVALRIALMETVIHGWDIAKATGQDTTINPLIAQPMLDGIKQMMTPEQRGPAGPFGPEISVPDDAPVHEKLVAFLGRKP